MKLIIPHRKKHRVLRGKHHNKTETKTTVSLYLNRKLVERARNRRLNLSRVTEQDLSSILDYLKPQNHQKNPIKSSRFLSLGSFQKERNMPRAGFEPATTRSSAERSPRLSYLGKLGFSRERLINQIIYVSS